MAQQGNSSLLAVLILFIMASGLVHMTSHIPSQGVQDVIADSRYYRDYYQAQSALQWGKILHWSENLSWQCHTYQSAIFSVCLYRKNTRQGVLRGASANRQLMLWQRVFFTPQMPMIVHPEPQGWSDDCPVKSELCYGH